MDSFSNLPETIVNPESASVYYVKEFYPTSFNNCLVTGLRNKETVVHVFSKYTTHYYWRYAAKELSIFVRKRVYDAPQNTTIWDITFVNASTNNAVRVYTSSKRECDVELRKRYTSMKLPKSMKSYLATQTTDFYVTKRGDVAARIRSTKIEHGSAYFMSCELQYTDELQAIQLWNDVFGNPGKILCSPPIAHVFEGVPFNANGHIYQDVSSKSLRTFNPLMDHSLILYLSIDKWADAWALRIISPHLRSMWYKVVDTMRKIDVEKICDMTPPELITAMYGNIGLVPDDDKVVVAGVCGLLNIWKGAYPCQLPIGMLKGDEIDTFIKNTTFIEMQSTQSMLDSATHQKIIDYIQLYLPMYAKLNDDFWRFVTFFQMIFERTL